MRNEERFAEALKNLLGERANANTLNIYIVITRAYSAPFFLLMRVKTKKGEGIVV